MRRKALLPSVVLAALAATVIPNVGQAGDPSPFARAVLRDAEGNRLGVVTLSDGGPNATLVRASLAGLPFGFHGFHVHATGRCTRPDFTSAGGHLNPRDRNHPYHAGDMPVLQVTVDNQAYSVFRTFRLTPRRIFDEDGSAIIVHENPDNYANIPGTTPEGGRRYHSHLEDVFGPDSVTKATGDAGARLACGVLRPTS